MVNLRFATVLLPLALVASPLFAEEPRSLKRVNLNVEGAIERLRVSNPVHYKKIATIIDGLSHQPVENVPRWIVANFNATNAGYSYFLRTSYPPKRELSFVLDDTLYNISVTWNLTASAQKSSASSPATFWYPVFPPRRHISPPIFGAPRRED